MALPKVMVVLPWQKHTNPVTAFSVMGLIDRSRTGILLNFGDAFVAHTRNTCADLFLQSDLEWMLTIDDDMVVPFGNGEWFNNFTGLNLPMETASLNAMDRLLSRGKTLVGALYMGRHQYGAPMYAEGMNNPQEAEYARKAPHDLLKPTRWVATGCLLIHRRVFLDIEKKYPRLARHKEGGTRGGNWFTSSEEDLAATVDQARAVLTRALTPESAYEALQVLESGAALARTQFCFGSW